jgi:hypothetical protein
MAKLGETADPKQLVPGNAANITATAQALRTRAGELEQAGVGLSRIDTAEGWSGPAGDAFRASSTASPAVGCSRATPSWTRRARWTLTRRR